MAIFEDLQQCQTSPCVERGCRAKSMISVLAGQERRKGRAAGPSIAPEPARRLDALQLGKIKRANRLQLLCGRGLLETVGQVVEPCLILTLEVEQGAYRILPALRSGPAVVRPAVLHAGLRCLAARSIAPLSVRVSQSLFLCTPLRNGCGSSVRLSICAPISSHRSSVGGSGRSRERRTKLSMR